MIKGFTLKYWFYLSFGALILIFAFPPPLLAQSAGATAANLTGLVTDSEGAAISGAVITISQPQTGFTREIRTSEDGRYRLNQVPPNNYQIMASADGFKPALLKLNLLLGTTGTANFILNVGGTTEVVEISAMDQLDANRIENSTSIDNSRIGSLPINRRDFLGFSLTSAKALADRVPAQGVTATSGLSFNGQSARNNSITIDGLSNNDVGSGSVRATFSQDAVQEFQVITDGYEAEFGRATSGVINIVTKGGTNQFNGSLFLFNRNDQISARDVFAPVKPPFSQYQFGATLSGPIKHNKIFFFNSLERISIKQNNIVSISDTTVAAVLRQGLVVGQGPQAFSVGNTTILSRIDAQLNPNDNLYVRYNFGGTYNGALEPFGGLVDQSNAAIQRLNDNSIAINNIYINAGLNLINETRFLYGRRNQQVFSFDTQPEVRLIAPEGQVRFGHNPLVPQPRQERIYQIIDNVSLSRGRNQIKFGIDYNYINTPGGKTSVALFPTGVSFFTPLNFSQLGDRPGLPTFSGLQALDPSLRTPQQQAFLTLLAGALPTLAPGFPHNVPLTQLSLPLLFGQGFGRANFVIPVNLFSAFAQDEIKLSPNLLVRFGIRYDINRVRFIPNNSGNFSPRIGISYHPQLLPKANIRASYGIFVGTPVLGTAALTAASSLGSYQIPFIPFPFSVLAFAQPGHHFPESTQLPANINFTPQLSETLQYDKHLHNSYSQQTSLGVDYELNGSTELSLNYTYVRGLRLFSGRQINPVVRRISGNPAINAMQGRTIPNRGDIFEYESAFDSYYHAVTFTLNRKLSNNIGLLASYTYSKTIDDLFDIRSDVVDQPANPLQPGQERALSLQDARSRFVLSGIWNLDYTKNLFLRDFQFSTIISLNSGRPYNLIVGEDIDFNGDLGRGDRPGPLGRNAGITPGFNNIDIRLSRIVALKDRYKFQGFVEIFNLFNRTNINDIDRIFPITSQGDFLLPPQENGRFIVTPDRFRSAFASRQFQLGFRLSF